MVELNCFVVVGLGAAQPPSPAIHLMHIFVVLRPKFLYFESKIASLKDYDLKILMF